MDFSVIERSGLKQHEFGDLCGVSRVTVNLWATGKVSPHRFIHDRVAAVIDVVQSAISGGVLPLTRAMPKAARTAALAQLAADVAAPQAT